MWVSFTLFTLLLSLRPYRIYLSYLRGDRRLIFKHFGSSEVHRVPTSTAQHVQQHNRTRAKSILKSQFFFFFKGKKERKKKVVFYFFLALSESSTVGLWLWLQFWHLSHSCYSPYSTWESFQEIALSWILLLCSDLLRAPHPLCCRV